MRKSLYSTALSFSMDLMVVRNLCLNKASFRFGGGGALISDAQSSSTLVLSGDHILNLCLGCLKEMLLLWPSEMLAILVPIFHR